MKPTYGLVSRYGLVAFASSLDQIGPFARSTRDCASIPTAIAGRDPHDSTSLDLPAEDFTAQLGRDLKGVRLGIPKEYFVDGMNTEVEAAVREAVNVLISLGASIHDISLPHTKYATATYYIICPSEVSSNMARYDGIRYGHTEEAGDLVEYYKAVRSSGFGKEVRRRIMIGTYALSAGYFDAYYRQAQKVRTLIRRDFDEAYKQVDCIISPVSPTPAFTVGAHSDDPVAMYLEDIFLGGQVMAGIPALSVPGGFSRDGLPIGLQVMGKQWGEGEILKVAHAYEQATQWGKRKPSLELYA